MDQKSIIAQIDRYINNDLTDNEQIEFELKIKNNSSLEKLVNKMKLIDDVVLYANLHQVSEKIKIDLKNKNRRNTIKKWIIFTLIVTSVLSVTLLFKNKDSKIKVLNSHSSKENGVQLQQIQSKEKLIIDSTVVIKSSSNRVKTDIINDGLTSKELNPIEDSILLTPQVLLDTLTNPIEDSILLTPQVLLDTLTNPIEELPMDTLTVSQPVIELNCDEDFEIISNQSCEHKSTGLVTILTDYSGDFTATLNSESINKQNLSWQNVNAGKHSISIKYNNSKCEFMSDIWVESEDCSLNKDFSFNPNFNETWKITRSDEQTGKCTILNEYGVKVMEIDMETSANKWDGTDFSGNIVKMGAYIALIENRDGSQEKVILTIIK